MYAQFQKYLFGEMGPPSSVIRSVLPATAQKAGDVALKQFFDVETKAFSYTYDSVLRTEMMKVQAGEREILGTRRCVKRRKNQTIGFTIVRMLLNALAPTSPKFTSIVEPLV